MEKSCAQRSFKLRKGMPRATSHLKAVRAFEAAARHESFAKAAVELCVSHSVISRHIRNLEQWLGTDLFVRSGNQVELTEDARLIVPKITAAFISVNDCFESLRKVRHPRSIVISAEPAIATRWLRRRLSIFRDEFPDIEIDLRASRSLPDVTDGTTDVAIHFESQFQSNDPSLQRLFPIDAYPACSPDFLREHSQGNGAVDFRDLPSMTTGFTYGGIGSPNTIRSALRGKPGRSIPTWR